MATNYTYEKDSMVRFGSFEKYNRVLYGGHANDDLQERFFTFAGDTPIFMGASSDFTKDTWCYQAKNGILMSGLAITEGYNLGGNSTWLHNSSDIRAYWHHGYMSYDLSRCSSYFPSVKVHIEIYPLNPEDGYVAHYEITTDQRVIFCAGFGGITPFFGRFEYHTSARKEFTPQDCENNTATLNGDGASVSGPNDVTMQIADSFGCTYELDGVPALAEQTPAMFLTPHDGEKCIVKLKRIISAGETLCGEICVVRNAPYGTAARLLSDGKLLSRLRAKIRDKYSDVAFSTPDLPLDSSVHDIMIALDASFHQRSFYHGAIGYHAPFLGWRGWYAPAIVGWRDRVKKAILSHFDTITRCDGEEKVWWDGADRPDLDHEGTQYHHIKNSSGHLTALLHKDDIYDMQEVAIDMTLYYLENTADDATAAEIWDRLMELLDWEERILDPDGDGLYQNFLNTWISDGHSYNGAGCAQASAYNYAANLRAARIGRRIGKDVSKLEARAAKIVDAMQSKLWIESSGVIAESLDTIGNKLLHPSPELSTTYLAIDCDTVSPLQAWRMLKWTERNIKSVKTAGRAGTLFFSSNWLPKKYSTYGLFSAENACLALAYYQNRQPEKGFAIVNGLADAFALSPNPGSLSHVLAESGGLDGGDIDFTDVSSCYLRLLLEGLWGVRWVLRTVNVAPQLPDEWKEAELALPRIHIAIKRSQFCETYTIAVSDRTDIAFSFPMRYAEIDQLYVNGKEWNYKVVPAIGRSYAELDTLPYGNYLVTVYYNETPFPKLTQSSFVIGKGSAIVVSSDNGEISEIKCSDAVAETALPQGRMLRFGDNAGTYDMLVVSDNVMLPLEVQVVGEPEEKREIDNAKQCAVDLSALFNQSITEIHNQEFRSPRPSGYSIGMRLNGRYAWEWNHFGHNALHVDDSILRKGGAETTAGWKFASPTGGRNALSVSLWEQFPTAASIPLSGKANGIAVLFCGTTNAMQLYVPNARLEVEYADGSKESVELVPPLNFDDFLHPAYQKDNDVFYIGEGTHALVQEIPLDSAKELKALHVEAIANEAIINILAVNLAR